MHAAHIHMRPMLKSFLYLRADHHYSVQLKYFSLFIQKNAFSVLFDRKIVQKKLRRRVAKGEQKLKCLLLPW